MAEFARAASRDDVWDGEMVSVTVGHKKVLLVNTKGELHAYDDRCAHQHVALSTGTLCHGVITCSAHGWQYDARTGCGVNPEGVRLTRREVRVENDEVFVDVSDAPRPVGVGPVLSTTPDARAVVAAIVATNPLATVIDGGAYLRVAAPEICRVSRIAIAHELKRAFSLPSDLERIMLSFSGSLTINDDEACWRMIPL